MHLKRLFSARCLCHVESFEASKAETSGGNYFSVLSALYTKRMKHIMQYCNFYEFVWSLRSSV